MAKSKKRFKSRPRRSYFHRRFQRRQFTLPIAPIAGMLPLAGDIVLNAKVSAPIDQKMRYIANAVVHDMTGYDFLSGSWNMAFLRNGLYPVMLGFATHKVIGGMLGVNRFLARARVPFFRL